MKKKVFILNKKRDIEQEFDLIVIAQYIFIFFTIYLNLNLIKGTLARLLR